MKSIKHSSQFRVMIFLLPLFFAFSCEQDAKVTSSYQNLSWRQSMKQAVLNIPPPVPTTFEEDLKIISNPLPEGGLVEAQFFALGGTGIGGEISVGEVALRELMQRHDRIDCLDELLTNGTPAARCYAIAAYKLIDKGKYEYLLSVYENVDSNIKVESGSISSILSFNEIVIVMRAGGFCYTE